VSVASAARKKKKDYVKGVLNPTDIAKNGRNPGNVRYINAQGSTLFNSVDYVQNFRAASLQKRYTGIQMLLRI